MDKFHAEVAYVLRRWGTALSADPFYNPNLSLSHARPTPAFPPRGPRVWATQDPALQPVPARPVPQTEAAL